MLDVLPKLFTRADLEQWVGPAAVRQGASFYKHGRVVDPAVAFDGGKLLAQGTVDDGSDYLRVTRLEWDGKGFQSVCNCPLGGRCKHAAALGVVMLENPVAPPTPPQGEDGGFNPGQEVILYGCWPAPPPKKLESLYRRPICLWLSMDTARLRDDLSPGTARPVGLWGKPKLKTRPEDQAILDRLVPFFQAHSRDISSPHARGIPLLESEVAEILELLQGYPFVFGGGRQPLSIRADRPIHERRISAWAEDDVLWELDGASIPSAPSRLFGDDPAWVLLEATLHPVYEAPAAEAAPEGSVATAPQAAPQVVHPSIAPLPRLTLHEEGDNLVVRLSFTYGTAIPLSPSDPRRAIGGELDGVWGFWQRDPQAESAYIKRLNETGLDARADGEWSGWGESALAFLIDTLPELLNEGWEVYGEERLTRLKVDRRRTSVSVRIASGTDWFDLETLVTMDDVPLDGASLLAALRAGSKFVRLGNGAYARLPEEWLARQQALAGSLGFEAVVEGDRLQQRLPRYQAIAAQELMEVADSAEADTDWHALLHLMQNLDAIPQQPVPEGFVGELRGYQHLGLDYLCFLRDNGLNGILADDMGLGKSIQAIALLLREKEAGRPGPSLLVAPTSVVYNWEQEFSRFAPDLKITVLHGSDRHAHDMDSADVVVTSYAVLRRDLERLQERRFHYVILDEAQMIKNPRSQGAKAARSLAANHRLCLTGTPIENNLLELWSLFHFLMPGYLGSERQFRDRYIKTGQTENAGLLRRRTQPFILRRLKQEVARDLPPRSDMVSFCELGPEQRRFYDELLMSVRSEVMGAVDRVGLARSRFNVLEGLLRLRQACCDPQMVRSSLTPVPSAKIEHFMDLVREISAEGHRVLVFSQFVKLLRILSQRLTSEGIAFEYLDGQTKDRLERVQRFNAGDTPIFLISLKAGGTGLNLTGADYVVHFDPWWNPAVEEQAQCRGALGP
ncbi:MAG TPA: SNF2-related protein, partial [Stenomitos sp.]